MTTVQSANTTYLTRDPKTLTPHPVSAQLYLDYADNDALQGRVLTAPEAANEVMEKMDVSDLYDSIRRHGICVPLIITQHGVIVSGCRRWKVAMMLKLLMVPVEVRTYHDDTEERRSILDYNLAREKTLSQKMREAELMKELIAADAKKRMLAGKQDPVPNLAQGSKDSLKTIARVGAAINMGKETYRKADHVWQAAKQGNPKAAELIRKLDAKTTSVDAAYNSLQQPAENTATLSRWQKTEPIGAGDKCTCSECREQLRIVHLANGRHRLVDTPIAVPNRKTEVNNNGNNRGD